MHKTLGLRLILILVLQSRVLCLMVAEGLLTQLIHGISHSCIVLLPGWETKISQSNSDGTKVENAHVACW